MPSKNNPGSKSQIDDTLDIVKQLLTSAEFSPPIESVTKQWDMKANFHFNYKDTVALFEERNNPFYMEAFEKAGKNGFKIIYLWIVIGDK